MFDIHFYMKVHDLKYKLMEGDPIERQNVIKSLEEFRSKKPIVYNIETTNACNMKCEMCPRTTMMTRSIEHMDMDTFKKVVDQLEPFSDDEWIEWENFVEKKYDISKFDMIENNFFLYIIPKVIVLHGYGDPLLDKGMAGKIELLNDRKIPSYFSCNPANIKIDETIEMFKNGLDYIKYSIESIDDIRHKEIRGKASNFTDSYKKILQLIDIKNKHSYKTSIIITMLNLNKHSQLEEFAKLRNAFKGMDVYVYMKSQDQQWYQNENKGTDSIHWLEPCQFPWSSMTIKSDGKAAMCVEDYNNEIILGDTNLESLYNIWNGEKYKMFREDHYKMNHHMKCTEHCDMQLFGSLIVN